MAPERPPVTAEKSAKLRLLEMQWKTVSRGGYDRAQTEKDQAQWEAKERNLTAAQKLERMHREERRKRLTVKEMGAIWLDACRGIRNTTLEDL
jgi:hypothetical protein